MKDFLLLDNRHIAFRIRDISTIETEGSKVYLHMVGGQTFIYKEYYRYQDAIKGYEELIQKIKNQLYEHN
jgi:DNA-binding LytR/AlgR family response regulator